MSWSGPDPAARMPQTPEAKAALRARMRRLRKALPPSVRERAGRAVLGEFETLLKTLKPGATVAGYLAIGSELDAAPLLYRAARKGFKTALPVVKEEGQPMKFLPWAPDDALTHGLYGTRIPAREGEEVMPGLLLAPLLAFDRSGHRLGQGGGYYDRAIARLREAGDVLCVGLGFSAQEVDKVPSDVADQRLDAVLTENGLRRFDGGPAPKGRKT